MYVNVYFNDLLVYNSRVAQEICPETLVCHTCVNVKFKLSYTIMFIALEVTTREVTRREIRSSKEEECKEI